MVVLTIEMLLSAVIVAERIASKERKRSIAVRTKVRYSRKS